MSKANNNPVGKLVLILLAASIAVLGTVVSAGASGPLPSAPDPMRMLARSAAMADGGGSVTVLAEANDDIPGVAIPASPVIGSVSATGDHDDVYAVSLTKGEYLDLSLTAPVGTDFDVILFSPTATTIDNTDPDYESPVAWLLEDTYPERVIYQADQDGTYYVDIWAFTGSGTYTLTWSIVSGAADDDIPGVALPSSPVNGSFDTVYDWRDVYSTSLVADQVFELDLTGDAGADFDMYLWGSETTSVVNVGQTPFLAESAGDSTPDESISYLVPPGGDGTHYVEILDFFYGATGGGDYTLTWKKSTPDVARLWGLNRYATSLAISRSSFTDADSVVFATGANYPDALAASGLAGVLDCPVILLQKYEYVSFEILQELHRLGVKDAYIVGGEGVVHEGVADALDAAGYSVVRLAGSDRYGTAKAVADKMIDLGASPDTVFLVSGSSFADALSVSPYAFNQQIPILLTRRTVMPDSMKNFITENSIDDVVIAGGTGVVSASVSSAADGLRSGAVSVHREGGTDRYATAAMVASYAIDTKGWASWDYVGVATGANYPDALSGGAAIGTRGGALLLARPTSLPTISGNAIDTNSASIDLSIIFGGSGAVSDSVMDAVEAAMN